MRAEYEIRGKAPKHQTKLTNFKTKKKENKPQSKVDTLLSPALSHCLGDMVVRMHEGIATIRVLNELNKLMSK